MLPKTKKFSYTSRSGTKFRCESAHFNSEIVVSGAPYNPEKFAADVAEMIAIHALEVWPTLNGFSGYDNLTFRLV